MKAQVAPHLPERSAGRGGRLRRGLRRPGDVFAVLNARWRLRRLRPPPWSTGL